MGRKKEMKRRFGNQSNADRYRSSIQDQIQKQRITIFNLEAALMEALDHVEFGKHPDEATIARWRATIGE